MGFESRLDAPKKDKLPLVAVLSAVALNMVGMADVNAGDWRVRTNDGGTMPTRDFRSGPGVRVSDYTPHDYQVSYPPYNGIPGGEFPGYAITYFSGDRSFNVDIDAEPVGPNRLKASKDLAGRLGVTLKDLCRLVANVGVSYSVNQQYGARELGFPGCPGSVRFPGDPKF